MKTFVSSSSLRSAAVIALLGMLILILAFTTAPPALLALCAGLIVMTACFCAAMATKNTAALQRMQTALHRQADGDYAADASAAHVGGRGPTAELAKALEAAQHRLLNDLAFARGVLNGMATPCVVVDTNEVLRFTNKNLLQLLQHEGSPEDFYGQNVAYFFYGDASRTTVLGTALREQQDITREVELIGRKGAKRNIRIDASPLYDLTGRLMGSLCVYADLTALRAQEASLLDVNRRIAKTSEQADEIGQQLAESARQLATVVETSRTGADQQSARMTDTAAAMEEMNATVMEVARNASQAAETSTEARTHAENGASVVGRVVEGIMATQQETLALKQDMSTLGSQAESIGQIMGVISDIADQTNLLALNAAIEAARAGDAGRGFAVVADEVRKLAEKTMTATKEVGQAIRGIQQGTANSVSGVEKAVRHIDEVAAMAGKSGEALGRIVTLAESTSIQVQAIATASSEQSSVSEEISRSIDEVSHISATTAQDMTGAARAVEELAGQAQVLSDLIREMQQA